LHGHLLRFEDAPPTPFVVSSGLVVISINLHKNMNTKSPECWASDPRARGLRIEVSVEYSPPLAHDEFAFAELKSQDKEQQFRLVFTMHEVLVRGHSLRRIETTRPRMELSFLARLPNSQG
jgi:hypothetical protein